MQLTIDRFGQMVLPKAMRDDFGLRAAMVAVHPAHERSLTYFERALSDDSERLVCTHSLAELYAV